MVIDELDVDSLRGVLQSATQPVLVDFWSPFCVPCRAIRRHIERIADRFHSSCKFAAVDVDKHQDAVSAFDIGSVPTFILFSRGETVQTFTGAILPSDISMAIEKITT